MDKATDAVLHNTNKAAQGFDQQRTRKNHHAEPEEQHGNKKRNMKRRCNFRAVNLFKGENQNFPSQNGKERQPHEFEQRIKKLPYPQRKTLVEKIDGDMPVTAGNDDHAGNGKGSHHKFLNFKRPRKIGPRISEKHIYGHGHGKQHQRHRTDNQGNSIDDCHNRFKPFRLSCSCICHMRLL